MLAGHTPAFPLRAALALALGALLAGLAIAPAEAPAKPSKTIAKSRSIWFRGPAGQARTLSVKCPRGSEAVSGGYRLTNHIDTSGQDSSALLPYASRRAGKRRWQVSAYKFGTAKTAEKLTALAYCRRGIGPLRAAVARSSIFAASFGDSGDSSVAFGTVTATCPSGTTPLSGGFRFSTNGSAAPIDGPPVAIAFGSRAVDRGWELTGARLRPGTMTMRSIAYCTSSRVQRRSKTHRFKQNSKVRRAGSPACPRGTSAVAGGFHARLVVYKTNSGGTDAGATFPIDSSMRRPGRWRLTGFTQGDILSPFTSYVYCTA